MKPDYYLEEIIEPFNHLKVHHRKVTTQQNEQPPTITLQIPKRIYLYLKPFTLLVFLMMVSS